MVVRSFSLNATGGVFRCNGGFAGLFKSYEHMEKVHSCLALEKEQPSRNVRLTAMIFMRKDKILTDKEIVLTSITDKRSG